MRRASPPTPAAGRHVARPAQVAVARIGTHHPPLERAAQTSPRPRRSGRARRPAARPRWRRAVRDHRLPARGAVGERQRHQPAAGKPASTLSPAKAISVDRAQRQRRRLCAVVPAALAAVGFERRDPLVGRAHDHQAAPDQRRRLTTSLTWARQQLLAVGAEVRSPRRARLPTATTKPSLPTPAGDCRVGVGPPDHLAVAGPTPVTAPLALAA
jgi:hypothetical protein